MIQQTSKEMYGNIRLIRRKCCLIQIFMWKFNRFRRTSQLKQTKSFLHHKFYTLQQTETKTGSDNDVNRWGHHIIRRAKSEYFNQHTLYQETVHIQKIPLSKTTRNTEAWISLNVQRRSLTLPRLIHGKPEKASRTKLLEADGKWK